MISSYQPVPFAKRNVSWREENSAVSKPSSASRLISPGCNLLEVFQDFDEFERHDDSTLGCLILRVIPGCVCFRSPDGIDFTRVPG